VIFVDRCPLTVVRAVRREDERPQRAASKTVNRQPSTNQDGFTLAGLIVICSIIMIFVAYTVPRQWSTIMKREREKQAIFVMKQYARAIKAFQAKNANAFPTSLEQLKKARTPRLIRGANGEWEDPLTGKVDWVLIPPQAANQPRLVPPNGLQTPTAPTTPSTTSTDSSSPVQGQAKTPKDYVGPFIGVRPPVDGESLLSLNGAQRYEEWLYTTMDLDNELQALVTPSANQVPTTSRP
jgi:type II secretory pathway pseudopilin PulG